MLVGILADSHGDRAALRRAGEILRGVEVLLHAGDHRRDGEFLSDMLGIPWYGVVGNTDPSQGPTEELLELAGRTLLLTHGHLQHVKLGLTSLLAEARRYRADIVVFGHTHIPFYERAGEVRLLNPGSIARPRDGGPPRLVRWDLGPPLAEPEFVALTAL